MTERGIIYAVYGADHREELIHSVESVKRQMPDVPITVFADARVEHELIDACLGFEQTLTPSENLIQALDRSPYERTIYLDSDVYATEPVDELFEMLERFDLGVVMDPLQAAGPDDDPQMTGVPWYNSGVICYRTSPKVSRFIDGWLEAFNQYDSNSDQPAFRRALVDSEIRYVTLPPAYNCLYGAFPGYLNGPVKLFHGRLRETDGAKGLRMKYDPVRARTRLNATSAPRVYRHGLGIQVQTESRLARLLHLIRVWGPRAALRELRRHMR
jgi:hypothetical protein